MAKNFMHIIIVSSGKTGICYSWDVCKNIVQGENSVTNLLKQKTKLKSGFILEQNI